MTDAENVYDHSIDESTSVQPQHFDADGYVISRPGAESDEPSAPDGQFDSQQMPTTDGEVSDPNAPVPGAPEGVPVDPDLTPSEPNPSVPDEPVPFAPDESGEAADPPRTVGGIAF